MGGLARPTLWALSGALALSLGTGGPHTLRAQVPQRTATVQGVVIEHETGLPLEGALVSLEPLRSGAGEAVAETTGPEGGFFLGEVSPGLFILRVTLLSYHEFQGTLRVLSESVLDLTLPLSVSPVPLDPIVVVSPRQPHGPMRAFEARRRTANGIFLTREEIQASGAQEFTDLLRTVPGARVIPMEGFGNRVEFRGGCRPDLWVDGVLAGTTANLDSFLRPEELEGVEVYKGAALPMEFGSNLCGAIVVWTALERRPGTDDDEGGNFWKRLALGAAFLLVAFLATH